MVKILLWGQAIRESVGGHEYISVGDDIIGNSIWHLFQQIEKTYPALYKLISNKQVSVSIDGNIFRDDWFQKIPDDAEICFMVRIPGG